VTRRRPRSRLASLLMYTVGIGVLLWASTLLLRHGDGAARGGETWRRGMLSGELITLQQDGRYVHARWCLVCADDVLESGTWAQFGETVSLVPSQPGREPRVLRKSAREGKRYLAESTPPGQSAPEAFARVE
jgi:hypothetical protein